MVQTRNTELPSNEDVIICSFLALWVNEDANTVNGEDQMSQYGGKQTNKLILSVIDILSLYFAYVANHSTFISLESLDISRCSSPTFALPCNITLRMQLL